MKYVYAKFIEEFCFMWDIYTKIFCVIFKYLNKNIYVEVSISHLEFKENVIKMSNWKQRYYIIA